MKCFFKTLQYEEEISHLLLYICFLLLPLSFAYFSSFGPLTLLFLPSLFRPILDHLSPHSTLLSLLLFVAPFHLYVRILLALSHSLSPHFTLLCSPSPFSSPLFVTSFRLRVSPYVRAALHKSSLFIKHKTHRITINTPLSASYVIQKTKKRQRYLFPKHRYLYEDLMQWKYIDLIIL